MAISFEVRELAPGETDEAAALLALAMRDNPLNVKAFGLDAAGRETGLATVFAATLGQARSRGAVLGAFRRSRLVGVCAFAAPFRCPASARERLQFVPELFVSLDLEGASRLARWVSAWSRHDPPDAHWHLGPLGVERSWRGRGVGTALLSAFCRRTEASPAAAYLETDEADNVLFYRKFGFRLVDEEDVLGVPNWFMMRRPDDPSHATGATGSRPPAPCRRRPPSSRT